MLYVDSNGKLEGGIYTGSTPGITSSSTVNNSTWHYAVLTVNKTSTTQTLYLDGSQVGTWSGTPEGPFTTVSIGAGYTASWPNPPSSGTSYFSGQIDDVRVSSSATARSANWITTEWNNQNSPSTFYSVGSAETNDSTPPTVSITAPTGGATIQNGQAVTASASDAGSGVQQVEFRYCSGWSCSFASGTTIGSPDTTSPYSVTWSSMPANGTYTIVARATDNSGNTADSSPVTVLVSNGGGGGSVGYDTASSTGGAAVTTLSWSHTVASQSNRMLVVGIQNESSSTSSSCQITSGYPKYNGVAMTKIASRVTTTASTYQCAALYYLAAPATGANTVQVNFDAAVDATAGAVSLYNVKQSAPDASNSSNNDSAATSTSVTTTSANSWVVDVFGSGQALGDLNSGASQTNRVLQDASGGSTSGGMSTKTVASPGSTTMSWTQTGINRSAQVVAAFAPINDSTPPTSSLAFNEGTSPGTQYEVSTGAHAWTYYYSPSATTTFTMTDTASDSGSGIGSGRVPGTVDDRVHGHRCCQDVQPVHVEHLHDHDLELDRARSADRQRVRQRRQPDPGDGHLRPRRDGADGTVRVALGRARTTRRSRCR